MHKQPFSIAVEEPAAGKMVLRIAGEVGQAPVVGLGGKRLGTQDDASFTDALRKVVPAPPKLVVMDLTGVTKLSSLGVGALLTFSKYVKAAGGEVRLVVTDQTLTLLKFGRIDQLFPIYRDVETALA